MIYQDTNSQHTVIEAHASLNTDEALAVIETLQLRGGHTGIVRNMQSWLNQRQNIHHAAEQYVIRGEAARQIRRTIAEAALGSVYNTQGNMQVVSDDIKQTMRDMDNGDDALGLGQAPTTVMEFEYEFAGEPTYDDAFIGLSQLPHDPQYVGRHFANR